MKARRWVLFIGLNIIVSVATTLVVLSLRQELEPVKIVTPTPGALVLGRAPSATPTVLAAEPVVEAVQPTPVAPSQYAVQQGDTLGGIALQHGIPLQNLLLANNITEDEFIQPGQVLIIPSGEVVTPTPLTPSPVPETPTPSTPTPFPSSTPTPPGPVEVRIKEVLAAGNWAREGVVLINRGRTVNLYGWTLSASDTDVRRVVLIGPLGRERPPLSPSGWISLGSPGASAPAFAFKHSFTWLPAERVGRLGTGVWLAGTEDGDPGRSSGCRVRLSPSPSISDIGSPLQWGTQ